MNRAPFPSGPPLRGRTNVGDRASPEGATPNPANTRPPDGIASGKNPAPPRRRVPMSLPVQRLEVQEIPGYRLYWFKEENIERALAAAYEFVDKDEVALNRTDIGGHPGLGGNTDMGTRVSLVCGTNSFGHPIRLYLMKLSLDYFKSDQMDIAMKNAERVSAIFNDESVIGPGGFINERGALSYDPEEGRDIALRGKKEFMPLFNRPKRVVRIGRGNR